MTVRSKKKTIAAAGTSLALAAVLVGAGLTTASASAWAASTSPGLEQVRQESPSPEPKPGRGGQGEKPRGGNMQRGQMQQAYLNALASRLGLTTDQLSEVMKQARIDLVNQAVAEGRLDQERANRMIQAIQSGQGPGQPGQGQRGQRPERPGQRGQQGPGQGQRGPGMPAAGQAVADLLGLTPQELRAELQSGKSLAQVAEAKGVSRDALKAKIFETQKARLDAAVAAGRMTAEQAERATARMSANVDRMLDAVPGQRRGPGTPGAST